MKIISYIRPPVQRVLAILLLTLITLSPLYSQTPSSAAKFRLGQGLEQAGDYDRAAEVYRELYKSQPANQTYFDALERVLLHLKRYDEAAEVTRERLQTAPGDVGLRAQLGSILYRGGKEQEAIAEWDRALKVEPSNPTVYRIVAGVLIENRLLDRAVETYRQGRSVIGDQTLFTLELAQLFAASMDYTRATEEYLRWLDQNPGQLAFVQNRLSAFSWKEEGRRAAIEVVNRRQERSDDPVLSELLGWLYLEANEFDRAFDVYRMIDKRSRTPGTALFTFAERAFRERAYGVAARAYEEALAAPLPPARAPQAQYGLAVALKELTMRADSTAAGEAAEQKSDLRPTFKDVVQRFEEIIRTYPHTPLAAQANYQIGTIRLQHDFDLDGALMSYEQVERDASGLNTLRYDVTLRIGDILTARGDTTGAADRYRKVAAADDATPDQSDEAVFRLAELDYFSGKFDEALQRLGTLSANLKADFANDALALQAFLTENTGARAALAQFAKADLLARQRKNSEAIALFQLLPKRFPGAPLLDDALMKTAQLQEQSGLYRDAAASYEQLLSTFTESSVSLDRAQYRLAALYASDLHDTQHAIAAYEKLLADYPQSVLAGDARKQIRRLRGEVQP